MLYIKVFEILGVILSVLFIITMGAFWIIWYMAERFDDTYGVIAKPIKRK